jgi:hypothetical protein
MLIKPDYISDKMFEVLSALISENKMYMTIEKWEDKYFVQLKSDTCLGFSNMFDNKDRLIQTLLWAENPCEHDMIMMMLAVFDSNIAFYLKQNFNLEYNKFSSGSSGIRLCFNLKRRKQ